MVRSELNVTKYHQVEPSPESCFRAITLFGQNTASYKFALGRSLIDLALAGSERVSLQELAEKFSGHLARHIKASPKQSTRAGPVAYFELFRKFNEGEASKDELVEYTERHAFGDVIDRFHIVGREDVPLRFYQDERKSGGGIVLTERVHALANLLSGDLSEEVESRWNLVETSWALNLPANLIDVGFDSDGAILTVQKKGRRVGVTKARGAINGYQRGRCFYCFRPISIQPGDDSLGEVDHFFPHVLGTHRPSLAAKLDSVWNLVLACADCNGPAGKWYSVPSPKLLDRLDHRNEYLIESNHPLKETIKNQTGQKKADRQSFLQGFYEEATSALIHIWEPRPEGSVVI